MVKIIKSKLAADTQTSDEWNRFACMANYEDIASLMTILRMCRFTSEGEGRWKSHNVKRNLLYEDINFYDYFHKVHPNNLIKKLKKYHHKNSLISFYISTTLY